MRLFALQEGIWVMRGIEGVLQDELNRLLDRIAAAAPAGLVERVSDQRDLRAQIDAAEVQMAALNQEIRDAYDRWSDSIERYAELWSMAGAEGANVAEQPAPGPTEGLRAA
jgi:hypothetical protein